MKLIHHLPFRLAEIKEIGDIQNAIDPELDSIHETIKQTLKNVNPRYADLEGVRIWEEWLHITSGSGKTLEERRQGITAKLNERLPYTMVQLHRMLAGIAGWEHFDITTYPGEPRLLIDLDLSSGAYSSVYNLLQRVVPAHVFWILRSFYNLKQAGITTGAFLCSGIEITLLPDEAGEVKMSPMDVEGSAAIFTGQVLTVDS